MADIAEIVTALMREQPVIFLGSVDPDGFPEIKAMLQPRDSDGIRTIYLATNMSSRRVAHFRSNPRACLYLCDVPAFHGVQLQGHVEILTDPGIKARLWRDGDALYYPGGPQDPDYCILKVTVFQGRRYSNHGSEDFLVADRAEPSPQDS